MKADPSYRIDALIRGILIVDEVIRLHPVPFRSESTQGHLLHIVESGEVKQQAEGRPEVFHEGHVIWYHECEPVKGRIIRTPWRFITINFTAPDLPPPPENMRVLPAGPHTPPLARRLLGYWRDRSLTSAERSLRSVAALTELLLDFMPMDEIPPATGLTYPANARDRWWGVEKYLRGKLDHSFDLPAIAALAQMSVRTTIRACKAATGMTPVQRLRELRLTYAHNLLHHSDLPVTEVGLQVGYARVQEFSRDFKKRHGCTPREMRNRPADYPFLQC